MNTRHDSSFLGGMKVPTVVGCGSFFQIDPSGCYKILQENYSAFSSFLKRGMYKFISRQGVVGVNLSVWLDECVSLCVLVCVWLKLSGDMCVRECV